MGKDEQDLKDQKKQKKAEAKSSKVLSQQKYRRRQWVTFMRMCRYGINNFTRNAWLTIAAMAVMTITLFVIFVSVAAHTILTDTLADVRDKVSMSIYLSTDTSSDDVSKVTSDLQKLKSVISVTTISPEAARADFISKNKDSAETLDAVKEATNKLPWSINIKVTDINNTSDLANFINDNATAKAHLDPNSPPSFAGTKRATIETIGRAVDFAQKVGIGASLVFVGISMLIIFNTIRMAIFNRRDEIQMMKLIGAEKSFIRGPFVVEAIVYGFFSALIASGLGYGVLFLAAPPLASYQINIQPTLDSAIYYVGFIVLGMIIIGGIIGVISSLLATRRYLKL